MDPNIVSRGNAEDVLARMSRAEQIDEEIRRLHSVVPDGEEELVDAHQVAHEQVVPGGVALVNREVTGEVRDARPRVERAEQVHARRQETFSEQHGVEQFHPDPPRARTSAAFSIMASVQVRAIRKCPR
jgi:hypothetical protein